MRLLKAVETGQISIVRAYINEGDDVDECSESGNNPILEAASRNDTKMVKLLLDNGAKAEVQDLRHNTPLYWAKENDNSEMEQLIKDAIENQARSSFRF